ncbi:uncharacterized protein EDB91DRAFT_1112257 [Suillus paluster]|uniref:uncharacterized protein n=1 Tax=Suillus paluster TaxID=48578 RepID=UPI001B873E90|nr:uncharacterized protein EDB91DRAFT_1112257 [Suillus paluster]KAG1749060.1 hypothetical protein EDB91DRAFT_1112257 [Suillus paluster]
MQSLQYKTLPFTMQFLSEDQIQTSVSSLRNAGIIDLASTLYTRLDNLSAPRLTNRNQEKYVTLMSQDGRVPLTAENKLTQFSPSCPTSRTFLLVCPWNRHDLGLPDFAEDARSMVD